SFLPVAGLDDLITTPLQHHARETANRVLIFHYQHGLRTVGEFFRRLRACVRFQDFLQRWQVDLECTALVWLAVNPDRTTALFDNPIDHGQSEAGAFAWIFRRKER